MLVAALIMAQVTTPMRLLTPLITLPTTVVLVQWLGQTMPILENRKTMALLGLCKLGGLHLTHKQELTRSVL